jgi:hypothetical protein
VGDLTTEKKNGKRKNEEGKGQSDRSGRIDANSFWDFLFELSRFAAGKKEMRAVADGLSLSCRGFRARRSPPLTRRCSDASV